VTKDDHQGKTMLENTTFELNFSTDLWMGQYSDKANKTVSLLAYIRYNDLIYTGIGLSDKGLSLFRGSDKEGKTNIIQIYLEPDLSKERKIFYFLGVKDTIAKKFEGIVQNQDLERDTKVVFDLRGSPFSGIKE